MFRWLLGLVILLTTACTATTRSEQSVMTVPTPTPQSKPPLTIALQASEPVAAPTATAAITATSPDRASCRGPSQRQDVLIPSEALGQAQAVRLYMPPCKPPAGSGFPVIYLLHGANNDENQWDDTEVDEVADAGRDQNTLPPVILVFPRRTNDSNSLRPNGDFPFEHFVVTELIPWVEKHTPAQPDQDHRAIGGISRGGFWALEIAFHHPELFSEVGGHSPAVGAKDDPRSPMGLLAANPAALRSLRVWLDVGTEDSLRTGTASLAASLEAADVPTTFKQWPGGHADPYWYNHTADYLAFYTTPWGVGKG